MTKIFSNRDLLIKVDSIWQKLLYSEIMQLMGDLYDKESVIKTWNMLSAEYNLGAESLLRCYSLVKAIS